MFIGRTDVEAETPILWLPDGKSWLIWKDPDSGKDWGQEEKEMTEDEMVGWHHWLNAHEFQHALGVGDGQGRLACCSPWGRKELDTTEQLKWTELIQLCSLSASKNCPVSKKLSISRLDGIIDSMDMRLSKLQEMVKDREAGHAVVLGVTKSWTGLTDWTTKTTLTNGRCYYLKTIST